MRVELWITGKRYRFSGDFGWYSGEDFALFNLTAIEISEDSFITLFSIKIAKFLISLNISRSSD